MGSPFEEACEELGRVSRERDALVAVAEQAQLLLDTLAAPEADRGGTWQISMPAAIADRLQAWRDVRTTNAIEATGLTVATELPDDLT